MPDHLHAHFLLFDVDAGVYEFSNCRFADGKPPLTKDLPHFEAERKIFLVCDMFEHFIERAGRQFPTFCHNYGMQLLIEALCLGFGRPSETEFVLLRLDNSAGGSFLALSLEIVAFKVDFALDCTPCMFGTSSNLDG